MRQFAILQVTQFYTAWSQKKNRGKTWEIVTEINV